MPIWRKRFHLSSSFNFRGRLFFALNSFTAHLLLFTLSMDPHSYQAFVHLCLSIPHAFPTSSSRYTFIDNNFRNISAVNGFGFVSVYSEWCSPFNENAKRFSIFALFFTYLNLSIYCTLSCSFISFMSLCVCVLLLRWFYFLLKSFIYGLHRTFSIYVCFSIIRWTSLFNIQAHFLHAHTSDSSSYYA